MDRFSQAERQAVYESAQPYFGESEEIAYAFQQGPYAPASCRREDHYQRGPQQETLYLDNQGAYERQHYRQCRQDYAQASYPQEAAIYAPGSYAHAPVRGSYVPQVYMRQAPEMMQSPQMYRQEPQVIFVESRNDANNYGFHNDRNRHQRRWRDCDEDFDDEYRQRKPGIGRTLGVLLGAAAGFGFGWYGRNGGFHFGNGGLGWNRWNNGWNRGGWGCNNGWNNGWNRVGWNGGGWGWNNGWNRGGWNGGGGWHNGWSRGGWIPGSFPGRIRYC